MTTTHRYIDMRFKSVIFAADLRMITVAQAVTIDELSALSGVSAATIRSYQSGTVDNMHMQNFIAVCNVLDLDPRRYFELCS